MKKLLAALLIMTLLPIYALAAPQTIDLEIMTVKDLTEFKDQLNLAIWNSTEWKEVTVPQGIWEIGKDIPVGHWTIKAADGAKSDIYWGDLAESKARTYSYEARATLVSETYRGFNASIDRVELDWELTTENHLYVEVEHGSVVFTPYEGKPSFTFD